MDEAHLWYNRKALGRDSWAVMTQAPTHQMIQELQLPKVSNTAFLGICPFSSPHQITLATRVVACLWAAQGMVISKSCKPVAEGQVRNWGCTSYITVQWLHTHTELSQTCYVVQHTASETVWVPGIPSAQWIKSGTYSWDIYLAPSQISDNRTCPWGLLSFLLTTAVLHTSV